LYERIKEPVTGNDKFGKRTSQTTPSLLCPLSERNLENLKKPQKFVFENFFLPWLGLLISGKLETMHVA
jgi:hypothetical protein